MLKIARKRCCKEFMIWNLICLIFFLFFISLWEREGEWFWSLMSVSLSSNQFLDLPKRERDQKKKKKNKKEKTALSWICWEREREPRAMVPLIAVTNNWILIFSMLAMASLYYSVWYVHGLDSSWGHWRIAFCWRIFKHTCKKKKKKITNLLFNSVILFLVLVDN